MMSILNGSWIEVRYRHVHVSRHRVNSVLFLFLAIKIRDRYDTAAAIEHFYFLFRTCLMDMSRSISFANGLLVLFVNLLDQGEKRPPGGSPGCPICTWYKSCRYCTCYRW